MARSSSSPRRTQTNPPRSRVIRIAHDFNNHLTAILGHCDLLERGAVGAVDAVREIRAAAEQAALLTRALIARPPLRTRSARRRRADPES